MPRSRGQSDLTIPPGELHENMGWEAGDVATIIVSKQMHSSRDESVRKVEAFFSTNKGPIFTFRDDSGGADAESDATRHRPRRRIANYHVIIITCTPSGPRPSSSGLLPLPRSRLVRPASDSEHGLRPPAHGPDLSQVCICLDACSVVG